MAGDRHQRWTDRFDPWLAILIVVMLLNTAALARSIYLWRRPGLVSELAAVRLGAVALGDFYSKQAKDLDLENNASVREALAKYRFEVEQALTRDEVARAMSSYGRNLSDALHRESQLKREQVALAIINQDPGVGTAKEGVTVTLQVENGKVVVNDPESILAPKTVDKLKSNSSVQALTELVQVQVRSGRGRLLTTRSLPGQIHTLRQEINRVQAVLEQAMQAGGFAELNGDGLLIRARQSAGQALIENVLGYDLRDIVNELFAAGARGIQVGSQRLIATSSIRAVGDTVLVNHKAIPTQPMEIKVVGDPEVLTSALDLITNSPYFGLVLDIQKQNVTLAAHPLE
ncbi:MAG: DUF881 domain-containing protein [Firmicutes bacterium]|nr:DUF881 domain-containing protein [Bacillota bacterium]